MSTLSQFIGGGVTTSIVNAFSSGGVAYDANMSGGVGYGTREVLSGALSAGALSTLLSITGAGASRP